MKKCLSEEETAESDCGESTDESSEWREVRRSCDREQPTTEWPFLANSRARARPRPLPTPVMSTVRLPAPAVTTAALPTMFPPPNDVVMASPLKLLVVIGFAAPLISVYNYLFIFIFPSFFDRFLLKGPKFSLKLQT